uniref:Structural maintenance of chromosomes protein n=1 Tax=Amphiprion percula TaxID=161767 RepID=A0A3P8SNC3_AMPPE
MSYLKQIEVENFKSWRGKQVIGPFMRFNCIIGTNGSGKSNVMDAVSFAMGERAAALRVKHPEDLIHGAHIGQPVSDTASVAIRFCDDEDQETVFCRTISEASSEYRINGVRLTLAEYTEELQKIGIVTKAQNCLVFQGAVESIALKDPKERTKMLECISQSKEFAAEYHKKKEALLKATEDTQFHFNKKKSVIVERNLVSHEKFEAERYQELLDELQQNRMQLTLAELYHNEKGIRASSDTLRDRQHAAAAKNETLVNSEQTVKTQKKEHGRHMREQQHIEKEIRTQEHILTQSRSQYVKAKVNTSHHMKKAEEARCSLKKSQKLLTIKEQELAEDRQEIVELERTWKNYEKQVREQEATKRRDIELDEDQLERYKELKELARKQGAVLRQQEEKLHWEVRADCEKMAFDKRRHKEVEVLLVSIRNNQTQLEDLTHRAEKLEEYTKTCMYVDYRQREERLSAELQQGSQRSEEVNQELNQVMEELGNARLDRQESKRQLQRKEVLEKLRRLYPKTVYGRLSGLCNPIHKMYLLAVTKVFGRYMNAIVVASEKVALDCITFIKEERAEPETFLPIDYLVVNPLNERLREMPGAKMVVDVVQVHPGIAAAQLRRVVQFVCGNALVCETIKEARSMAFDRHERFKTVSLDGTLFAKSGTISGGSSDLRSKARCWDEKDMMHLKERKDQLVIELHDLMRLKRKESDLRQIIVEAQGAQTRLKYSKAELENLRKKVIVKCQEISQMKSELANLSCQIQMQHESVEAKNEEIKAIRDQIDQMEDLVFSDFCADIGMDNIREYEQEHLKQQAELDNKRLEFEIQHGRLTARMEYEQHQMEQLRKKLCKMEDTINEEERTMAEERKDEMRLLEVVEEGQNKLLELNNQLLSKKSQVAAVKAELDQKNQSLQQINKELVKLQREVMSAETALEQKRLTRHNMLLACKIQDLPITLLSGSLNEISDVQTDSESTSVTMDVYEREAHLVIDYSELEAELRGLQAEEEVEAYLTRLSETVLSIEGVLNRTAAPNLKALQKMREIKDKLQGMTEAFDASTKAARKCSQEFEQVKAQRFQLFSQCFEHVSVVIDQIYKRICRNSSAQAILSAENPDEPYLGGISYNCVAPGKRFMSMENLSGGEKAIAALAFIFAIHSFRPAPFFILDEVDAALDNSNIGKVTSFIREESKDNMQIIIISLKQEFFSRADALLGVYSTFDECMFSRILTLDLRPYPLDEEERDTDQESTPQGSCSLESHA